jgi:hypothetical protein
MKSLSQKCCELAIRMGWGIRDGYPATRFSMSVDRAGKLDIWLRLPRWISHPVGWWQLRKVQ